MKPVNLDTILLDAYEKYEPVAVKKQIQLQISLPEETLPDCTCDRERISQVLSILLDNALSYTPLDGKISLSLSFSQGHFLIEVSDNGPGVADGDKKHIFERFYRADNAHTKKEHFGLGLCVANEIIKAHKGKIWVEDRVPCGASFFILL